MAAILTDELMHIQKILFDGYMRTEILMNFKSKLSNIMTDDVINLCNKFFVLNIDEMMNKIKISKQIDDDSIEYQLSKFKRLSMDLLENKDYFIATKLLNSLITKENEIKQSHDTTKHSFDSESDTDDEDDFERKWVDRMEGYYILLASVFQKWDPSHRDQAIPILEKLTELKPNKDIYFYNIGMLLEDNDQYQAALTKFKTAVTLNDTDPDYIMEVGYCYAHINQNDEASKWYLKAIELAPESSKYHAAFAAFSSRNMGDLQTSEIHFKRAIELEPENAESLAEYARFLRDYVIDYKESEKYFIRSLELESIIEFEEDDYSTTNAAYAYLLHLMGDDDKARKYIKLQLDLFGHIENYWISFYDGLLNEEREEISLLKAVDETRTGQSYQYALRELELMKQGDVNRIDYYQKFEKLLHDKFRCN